MHNTQDHVIEVGNGIIIYIQEETSNVLSSQQRALVASCIKFVTVGRNH